MKTAILIHGMPSKAEYLNSSSPSLSNKHWFPWLQKQLLLNDILAQTPEMPTPYQPDYEKWKETFEQFKINENTILIGHSCGGGFLVRWLSENPIKINKLFLIAPWIDPSNNQPEPGFFDFKIDKNIVERTTESYLYISSDDDIAELNTADLLEKEIKDLQIIKFENKGHFTLSDMGSEEFPELLEKIIK